MNTEPHFMPTHSNLGTHPTLMALRTIESGLTVDQARTGTFQEFGPEGSSERPTYSVTQACFEEIREDLTGAAFVIAQTYLKSSPKPLTPVQENIGHVANYWKHRDEWNAQWTGKANPRTVEPIKKLGGQPPVAPGQLESLVQAVLGEKFGADALWKAIRRETDAHG